MKTVNKDELHAFYGFNFALVLASFYCAYSFCKYMHLLRHFGSFLDRDSHRNFIEEIEPPQHVNQTDQAMQSLNETGSVSGPTTRGESKETLQRAESYYGTLLGKVVQEYA